MGAYDDLILSHVPALYWKLDETSGTVVNDSSGNARHGKLYSSQVVSGSGVELGKPSLIRDQDASMRFKSLWTGAPLAQSFPGTGIRADAYAPYQAGSKRSFEVWLRKEDEASFATIFSAKGDDKPSTTLTGAHGPFPVGTITVGSTTGFPAAGDELTIAGVTGFVTYSSKNATQFLGCSGGTGSASGGAAVAYGVTANHPTWEMGANGMMRYYADVNHYPTGFVDWGSANTGHPSSIFRPYQPMHIVCTFDDSSGVSEFWVNGISMGKQGPYGYLSGTWPMAYSELGCDAFQFGWRGDVNLFPNPGNTECFGGYAQKLAIYERILTEAEIISHARAGSGATPLVVSTHDGATSTAISPTGGSRGAAGIWLAGEENEGLLPITQYDEEFTESAFSEGGLRTRSRPTNGVGTGKVYVAGATEDEFAVYLDEWQRLVEDMRRDGGTIQYTRPDSSTPVTYDVLSFKITEVPYDGRFMSGYVAAFVFEFTCRPYGRLSDVTADLAINDRFSSSDVNLARGDWLFDTGSGSAIVFGDRLVMSTTAEKRMYRGATKYENSTTWLQFITGASVASGSAAAMAKRIDASNYLMARVTANGTSSVLEIVKCDATVLTALATSSAFVLNPMRMYWVELVVNGNGLTANLYAEGVNSLPEADYYPDVDPIATVSYTLAGGDATKYGTNVWANNGLRIIPQATDWAGVGWRTAGQRVRSTRPIADFDIEDVPGHVDALGDLTIIERSSKSRHHLEVGLTNVYDLDRDAPVLIDSDQFVVSGYSGAQSDGTAYTSYGLSAAYDPLATSNIYVTAATNSMKSIAVCGLGDWGHVGKHRVRARVAFGNASSNSDTCKVRLTWRIGDGPLQSNRWIEIPVSPTWKEIDLGVIDVPESVLGTQRWTGQIDAVATGSNAGRVFVDYAMVIPADRYVKSSYTYDPTAAARAITALDDFSGATGVLTGDTAPTGGIWTVIANSDADDFQNGFGGWPGLTRIAGSDAGTIASGFAGRYLYAASSTATDILASLDAKCYASAGDDAWGIVFHRNGAAQFGCVKVVFVNATSGQQAVILLYKVVAGTPTLVGLTVCDAAMISNWWRLQVATDGSGNVYVYLQPQASEPILRLVANDSVFATAGALASGTQGIFHENTAATLSWWELDNFNVVTPVYDAALFSGRTARIRARDALREDSAGTYWGQLPGFVGARLLVPPAGMRGNASKLAAKARRLNVDAVQDEAIADEMELGLTLTPRVLLL